MLFEKVEMEPDEKIIKTVRKHWFIIVTELFVIFFMFLTPFFVLSVFSLIGPNLFLAEDVSLQDYTALIAFSICTWSLLCLMSGFMTWTHYYLDLWVITDRRIIIIDQINFFNRKVGMFRMERLQDIEFSVNGIIPTFLDFGTLQVRTAGHSESDFSSKGLPNPRELQAVIQKAMDDRIEKLHDFSELTH